METNTAGKFTTMNDTHPVRSILRFIENLVVPFVLIACKANAYQAIALRRRILANSVEDRHDTCQSLD